MGELPEWYSLIQVAKWMGVAPWELAARPVAWMEWALATMNAEANASEQRKTHATRKAKNKRK